MQIEHADRRRDVPRKEALLARRIRQRTRKVGFTPVRNARIESRVEATQALLSLAYQARAEKSGAAVPSGADIQREAWQTVARGLPSVGIGTRTRGWASTSKYNQENTAGNR